MAKHVTVFSMQVKPGKLDELIGMMGEERAEEMRLKAAGWESTVVGKSRNNANEIWVTVTWDTSENYARNAQSPEQDTWFQKMRALLDSDPAWHDCEVLSEQRA